MGTIFAETEEQAEKRAQEAEEMLLKQKQEMEKELAEKAEKEATFKKNQRENMRVVHNIILNALKESGISDEIGRTIVTLFVKNSIPLVTVKYHDLTEAMKEEFYKTEKMSEEKKESPKVRPRFTLE